MDEVKAGSLVTDKNYGRLCAVLAIRGTRALVALRTKSYRNTQLRWRPFADLQPVSLQSRSEAMSIALAAMRTRMCAGRTIYVPARKGRVDPVLRLMLARRPFGTGVRS